MTPALILSSDSHVFEPPDLWTTRIDRAFRDRAPRKFGIHIGHMGGPLGEMRKLWKFADAKGFDWFSVSDHFQESPPRGGDMSCYEAIATLTAAAMDTQRIRLGSGVYCVAYRNPGLLAKSLTTIDHLSNGRVDCGLGAGWHDVEAKAYGFAFPSIGPREDMLEEYAQIMRLLLDPEQPRASFEGKHFRVADAPNTRAMVDEFRALGCTRLRIALREGPYDWEALEAFAAE
ncbi:MAG TPA: LLM class flavin-dependent oxidoreductase, partial [Methylomirabilota bacterium]|nr:LLM class flavin-dependent oxidoreductase [Methylomirabilota bacterium]